MQPKKAFFSRRKDFFMSPETGFVCPQKQCLFVTGKSILLSPEKKTNSFVSRKGTSSDTGFFCRLKESCSVAGETVLMSLETGIFYSQEEYSSVTGKRVLSSPEKETFACRKARSCCLIQNSIVTEKRVFVTANKRLSQPEKEKILLSHQNSYVARRMGLVSPEVGFFFHRNEASFVAKGRVHLL